MVNTLPRAGIDSWALFSPETTYGTAATTINQHFGIVQSVTPSNRRNLQHIRGFVGSTTTGRDMIKALGGKFETSVTVDFQPQHFDWFKYVIGTRTGAGTSTDNYVYCEKISDTTDGTTASKLDDSGASFDSDTLIGQRVLNTTDSTQTTITAVDSGTRLSVAGNIFTTGEAYTILVDRLTSLTIATNIELGTTDRTWKYLGAKVNSCTIRSAVGEPVSISLDLIGADVDQTTTLTTAVALDTADVYNFTGSKIEMSNGTVNDNGDQIFTGSVGGDNSTDNSSLFIEGAGETDNKSQNMIANSSSATKTWTIADLTASGNAVTATNPFSAWIYIKDATALAKFLSSGTCLNFRFRTNGDAANKYYEHTVARSTLVVGWNFITSGGTVVSSLTAGAGGAPSGALDEFVINIITNASANTFIAGDVLYDLLREGSYINNIIDNIEITITNNVEILYGLGSYVGQEGISKSREYSLRFGLKTRDSKYATYFLGGATDVSTPTEITSAEITLAGGTTHIARFLFFRLTLEDWADSQTHPDAIPEEFTVIAESLKVLEQQS